MFHAQKLFGTARKYFEMACIGHSMDTNSSAINLALLIDRQIIIKEMRENHMIFTSNFNYLIENLDPRFDSIPWIFISLW